MDERYMPGYMRATGSSRRRVRETLHRPGPPPPTPTPPRMPFGLALQVLGTKPTIDVAVDPKRLVKQLRILGHASKCLAEDVNLFLREQLHLDPRPLVRAAARSFLVAALYYGHSLMKVAFDQIASATIGNPENPNPFAHAVQDARLDVTSMQLRLTALQRAFEAQRLQSKFTLQIVPSAGPYQFLHQALLGRLNTSTLDAQGVASLLSSLAHRAGINLGQITNPGFIHAAKRNDNIPCGYPSMCFVAFYPHHLLMPNGRSCFTVLLGCNQPNWGQLKAVAAITREARDQRLQNFSRVGDDAFTTLQQLYNDEMAQVIIPGRGPARRAALARVREDAARRMGTSQHFLGGRHEHGLAFRGSDWEPQQCCYTCDSTMGYIVPTPWTVEAKQEYHNSFD